MAPHKICFSVTSLRMLLGGSGRILLHPALFLQVRKSPTTNEGSPIRLKTNRECYCLNCDSTMNKGVGIFGLD